MVDLSVTAANVATVGDTPTGRGTAGGSITAGQSVYKDSSDNYHLKLADASAEATAEAEGIALHAAEDGQPLVYATGDGGSLYPGTNAAAGVVYVVSATAGGIAPIADLATGEYVTILGVGDGTNIDLSLFASGNALP